MNAATQNTQPQLEEKDRHSNAFPSPTLNKTGATKSTYIRSILSFLGFLIGYAAAQPSLTFSRLLGNLPIMFLSVPLHLLLSPGTVYDQLNLLGFFLTLHYIVVDSARKLI